MKKLRQQAQSNLAVSTPKVIGSGKKNARRTWWLDQHTGRNEKLHVHIPQADNQHKDSHRIYLIFRETHFQKRETPHQDERMRTICCRGVPRVGFHVPIITICHRITTFRVARGPREASPFNAFENPITLRRKTCQKEIQ